MRTAQSLSESIVLSFVNPFVADELRLARERFRSQGVAQPRLLDVGCGRQPYRSLIEQLGFDYCSLDVAARGVRLDVEAAIDDRYLPDKTPGGRYHVLLLTEVLEHIDDPHSAWENLRHLAADQAIVVLTTPFVYPLHEEPFDACRPTLFQIGRLAERSGFRLAEAKQAGTASDVVGLVLANLFVPEGRSWMVRGIAQVLRIVCRLSALLIVRTRCMDVMGTKFYVSNLVRCERVVANQV